MRKRFEPDEALIGIVALLIGIVSMVVTDHRIVQLTGIAIAVVMIVIAIVKWRKRPPQIDPGVTVAHFTLENAVADDLPWIAALENKFFGEAAVPLDILREWHAANPFVFTIIRNQKRTRVGHIDVLPVKDDALQMFVKGTIIERGIRGSSLYPPAERDNVKNLYVESVIIEGESDDEHKAAISELLRNIEEVFTDVANPANVEYVYGLAATRAGREFMERHGFDLISPADGRADHHPLYRASYAHLMKALGNA